MNAPDVRPARSDAEAHEAFALALSIFGETTAVDAYRDYKSALWFDDPAYAPENVIVARSGGAICGVSRIVPRTLYRRDQPYAMAGISSVCVAAAMQGRGLSRTLIEHTLERCRARGFDFAFLVARRAADHYYTRFGFWGVASYSRMTLRLPESTADPALTLDDAGAEDAGVLSAAHEASYARTFGRIARSEAYWLFMLERCRRMGLRVASIRRERRTVGYAICSGAAVHELAYIDDVPVRPMLDLLASALPHRASAHELTLSLPAEHPLVAAACGLDLTLAARECPYGGHMVRVLNARALLERIATRSPDAAAALAPLADAPRHTHRETSRLLGAWSPTETRSLEAPLHFDIGIADEV